MESCQVDADDVIIRYNNFCCKTSQGPGGNAGEVILVNNPVNTMIYGNYIDFRVKGGGSSINVFNNIFGTPVGGSAGWQLNSGCNFCIAQNNIVEINSFSYFQNYVFRNNIVASTQFSLTNSIPENNIFVDNAVDIDNVEIDSLGNGNIDSVDINTVWDLTNPSPDGRYMLIGTPMSNPAIGGGASGEDCGIFGGSSPYRLSGVAKIPAVYQMLIPLVGDTTNMLIVTIKAKSND